MDATEIMEGLSQELRRGTIVLCVLSELHKPMYGYNLVEDLKESGVPVEANTLYPLLRRLEGQGLLQSEWDTGTGKPRKYYRVTPLGDEVYNALADHWRGTVDSVEKLLQKRDEK